MKKITDIALKRQALRTESSSRMAIDVGDIRGDLSLRDGLDNIAQAVQNRLLTRKGEISKLGHESYGSDLYKLIGEPNSWKAKARAELYIREALRNERRIEQILDIYFPEATTIESQSILGVIVLAKVKDHDDQLRVELALNLEG